MNWVFRKAMKPMITTQKRVQGPSLRITVLKEKKKNQMEIGFTSPEEGQRKRKPCNSSCNFSNRNPIH